MWSGTRALESRLAAAIDRGAREFANAMPTQALELIELVVDDIASHVQPAGRGRYVFPFNRIGVTFVAPTTEDRARLRAVAEASPRFDVRVLQRLAAAGCHLDADAMDIRLDFVDARDPDWPAPYRLSLARVEMPAPATLPPAEPNLWLDVLVTHGSATSGAYSFDRFPIAIGRGEDVRDRRQQLIRLNHVAFIDAPTVSRRHARIELDAATRRPRIIDENSAQGTSVLRGGRSIAVPRGSRGLALQDADEIVLGEARIRVQLR
jgi:hypothetical protein